MIKNLYIANYALIEETRIALEPGFTVITGETGAGKSILLGAVGLTLGQRVDSSVVRDKRRKCVVEATYEIGNYHLQAWFEENDLDYDDEVIVRREITPEGKSRSFVNDTPVNNKVLRQLGDYLVDIHSQHQSLLLGQPGYQLDVLDEYCGNRQLLDEYKKVYGQRQRLLVDLEEVKRQAKDAEQEEDYLRFQFNQLDEARLREDEQEQLESELAVLNHAETIKTTLSEVSYVLSGEEPSVIHSLKNMRGRLAALADVLKEAGGYEERINSVILELEDIADEAERRAEDLEVNPARVDAINDRLNVIYELQRKHRLDSVKQLLELQDELGERLRGIASYAVRIEELERDIKAREAELDGLADKIHKARVDSEKGLCEEMRRLLVGLGIKHATFSVSVTPVPDYTPKGKDEVKFLFAANKNQQPGELAKVASGGEISRLMLSLKYILSRTKLLPVIIFDEIDTGVSGDIAHRMAVMMREMAARMQVVSISHLPQIAAIGDTHFKVYKDDEGDGTISRIRRLTEEERVREIAGMMSGSEVNAAALENARMLLRQR